MGIVRVSEPVTVRDPEAEGVMVTLDPRLAYRDDDPLVKAYPWAFASEDVESATRAPGEKRRSVKRPDVSEA